LAFFLGPADLAIQIFSYQPVASRWKAGYRKPNPARANHVHVTWLCWQCSGIHPLSGFCQRREGNRAKSTSLEQRMQACSTASAVKWASGTRLPVTPASSMRFCRICQCNGVGCTNRTQGSGYQSRRGCTKIDTPGTCDMSGLPWYHHAWGSSKAAHECRTPCLASPGPNA